MMKLSFLSKGLSKCCNIDAFPISLCSESEEHALRELLPEGKSVIILAHHVKHELEWAWFPFEAARNNVTCAADFHLKVECEKILSILAKNGYHSVILPYPGRCGIRFKDLANKSGLGKIGDNFLFLHKAWGPWTQLQVIFSEADISDNFPPCKEVCNHCGRCKVACPAKVIKDDILLGVECDEYQEKRDGDIGIQGSYVFKCEECVRACPIGNNPERITIDK